MSNAIVRIVSAVIWNDDSILCCKSNAEDDVWEFPSWPIDEAETSLEACRRNVQEKLGCRLSTTWLLDTIESQSGGSSASMDCFVAMLGPSSMPNAEGAAELRWLSRDELAGTTWKPEHDKLATMVGSLWDQIFMSQHL